MKKILVIAAAMVCLVMGRPIAHAQDAGINGKWHFVLETPGGDREVDADLTVDADGNVTGKWGNADVAGTYKDGKLALEFQFTSEEVGATAAMKIDGKMDDTAALAGDWAFSEYNGTYKATRPGAAAPVRRQRPRLQHRHRRQLLTQSRVRLNRSPIRNRTSSDRSASKCGEGPDSMRTGPFVSCEIRLFDLGWRPRAICRGYRRRLNVC